MARDINSEQEGRYDILQNNEGAILIMIKQRRGGPENPRFVYDGGDTALLYRSRESAVFLGGINADARNPLNPWMRFWLRNLMVPKLPVNIWFRFASSAVWMP